MASPKQFVNLYDLLSVPADATLTEIKSAYRRTLLNFHPDKQKGFLPSESTPDIDMAVIKDAYLTLSTPHLRKQYDSNFKIHAVLVGPRPAQVVSLDDFEEEDKGGSWRYPCRCGGVYRVTMALMESGEHLIGCGSCSEVVWAGYELQDDDR